MEQKIITQKELDEHMLRKISNRIMEFIDGAIAWDDTKYKRLLEAWGKLLEGRKINIAEVNAYLRGCELLPDKNKKNVIEDLKKLMP